MKILLAGGGTAGHINPALAIASYIREKCPETDFLYVGANRGMEKKLVLAANFPFFSIQISGFQRKITPQNIIKNVKTTFLLLTSSYQAKKKIRDFKPDLCIGTGGYVSGPVIRAAAKLGVPCIIHEQNALPGLTTKMLSKKVKLIMLAIEEAKQYLPSSAKCILTGNPIRQEVIEAKKEESRKKLGMDERPVILSFGGSLGARTINEVMKEIIKESIKNKQYQHIHAYGQYGQWLLEELKKGFVETEYTHIKLYEYIHNMATCLAAADLVICRAGANTLSELKVQGKASILIPSPNVAENHQYHNAAALVKQNAAILIEAKDLNPARLKQTIVAALKDQTFIELGINAKKMAVMDTNERIFQIVRDFWR